MIPDDPRMIADDLRRCVTGGLSETIPKPPAHHLFSFGLKQDSQRPTGDKSRVGMLRGERIPSLENNKFSKFQRFKVSKFQFFRVATFRFGLQNYKAQIRILNILGKHISQIVKFGDYHIPKTYFSNGFGFSWMC